MLNLNLEKLVASGVSGRIILGFRVPLSVLLLPSTW